MKNPNEYTDEEIYEMLRPKLIKAGIISPNLTSAMVNKRVLSIVALCYKSGYLRAQKGRSFIIGEKKEEKPNLEYRDGALVRYLGRDAQEPYIGAFYPNVGTIGKVIQHSLIDWGEDSNTEGDHRWFCEYECLEVIG